MLARIFGSDKKRMKELEDRLSQVEEGFRQLQEHEEEFRQRAEALEGRLARVEAADTKLAQALMELVKTLGQDEVETPDASRDDTHWSPSPELEDEILQILRNGGPATPRTIAEKLGKTREHLSRTLKSMAARGRITRRQDGKVFVYSIVQEL
ncbi:MAG TPA: MarR family transcriptional regulator [Thermoproteota archaeon]|nr:MarR family transcriptional regulator [Thermoproteota archaeon]